MNRSACVAFLACALLGCAPAQRRAALSPASAAGAAPRPKDVALVFDMPNPRRSLEKAGLGTADGPWAHELASHLVGAPVERAVNLSAPLSVAVAMRDNASVSNKARYAVAIGLGGSDAGKASLSPYFHFVPDGEMTRLDPKGTQKNTHACYHFASPARLICASSLSERDLVRYLGHRSTERVQTDVSADVFVAPLVEHLASTEHSGSAAEHAGYEIARHAFGELERISLDANYEGQDLVVGINMRMRDVSTPLARAILSYASQGPPPSAMWRFPSDTQAVWFTHGSARKDLEPLHAAIFDTLESLADGEDDWRTVEPTLRNVFLTGGPLIVAAGNASRKPGGGTNDPGIWVLAEMEEPAEVWLDSLRALARVRSAKRKKPDVPEKTTTDMKAASPPKGAALPSGTQWFEWKTTPNAAYARYRQAHPSSDEADAPVRSPSSVHLLVVPDGGRTWFSFADDFEEASSRVKSCLVAQDKQLHAEKWPELQRRDITGGGFWIPAFVEGAKAGSASSAPHTPLTFVFIRPKDAHTIRLEYKAPKAFVLEWIAHLASKKPESTEAP